MCILVNALKRQDPRLTLEVRVGLALAEVGPSMTLASLTEVFAFSIGALAPTPACKEFSLFAGRLNFSFLSNHIDMRATLHYDQGPWPWNCEAVESHPKAMPCKIEIELWSRGFQCKGICNLALDQMEFHLPSYSCGVSLMPSSSSFLYTRQHALRENLNGVRGYYSKNFGLLTINCEIFLMQLLQCYWIIFSKWPLL